MFQEHLKIRNMLGNHWDCNWQLKHENKITTWVTFGLLKWHSTSKCQYCAISSFQNFHFDTKFFFELILVSSDSDDGFICGNSQVNMNYELLGFWDMDSNLKNKVLFRDVICWEIWLHKSESKQFFVLFNHQIVKRKLM